MLSHSTTQADAGGVGSLSARITNPVQGVMAVVVNMRHQFFTQNSHREGLSFFMCLIEFSTCSDRKDSR